MVDVEIVDSDAVAPEGRLEGNVENEVEAEDAVLGSSHEEWPALVPAPFPMLLLPLTLLVEAKGTAGC